MKKSLPWFIVVGLVGVIFGILTKTPAQEGRSLTAPGAMGAPSASSALPTAVVKGGTVVHTFEDQDAMRSFAIIWQQRQGITMRMNVLQTYWNSEQTLLAKMNEQLKSEYSLDTTSNYFLNGEERQLIEREAPPVTTDEAETEGETLEEKIAYQFSSDEQMQEFTQTWQRRQAIIVRRALLQAYWNDEQTNLATLNSKLAEDYAVDVEKNYFIDGNRRVLLEYETAQGPAEVGAS